MSSFMICVHPKPLKRRNETAMVFPGPPFGIHAKNSPAEKEQTMVWRDADERLWTGDCPGRLAGIPPPCVRRSENKQRSVYDHGSPFFHGVSISFHSGCQEKRGQVACFPVRGSSLLRAGAFQRKRMDLRLVSGHAAVSLEERALVDREDGCTHIADDPSR